MYKNYPLITAALPHWYSVTLIPLTTVNSTAVRLLALASIFSFWEVQDYDLESAGGMLSDVYD